MSKTVTIPANHGDPWSCSVNNVKYTYAAGSTQEVPDAVAEIVSSADDFPVAPPETEAPFQTAGGGGAVVVRFSVEGGSLVADKTPTEVLIAMQTQPVAATLNMGSDDIPLGCFSIVSTGADGVIDSMSPCVMTGIYGDETIAFDYTIYVLNGEWMLHD